MACCPDLGLLPLCTGLLMALSILTTYIITVCLGHADPLLPSISDTGIYNPEMHFFSQFLNIVAVMAVLTFIVRYKAVQSILDTEDLLRLRKHSRVSLVLGIIAAVGLSIVANFQDDTAMVGHLIGALLVFLLGNIYILFDAALTYRLHPKYSGRIIFWIRLLLGIVGLSAFISTMVAAGMANKVSENTTKEQRLHWKPSEPGYPAHLASTMSEWIMGLAFICYFFTYIKEFRQFGLKLHVSQLEEYKAARDPLTESLSRADSVEIPTERSPLL